LTLLSIIIYTPPVVVVAGFRRCGTSSTLRFFVGISCHYGVPGRVSFVLI
jgi:hypothetical protein